MQSLSWKQSFCLKKLIPIEDIERLPVKAHRFIFLSIHVGLQDNVKPIKRYYDCRRLPKGRILHCERWLFMSWKAVFYTVKGHLLVMLWFPATLLQAAHPCHNARMRHANIQQKGCMRKHMQPVIIPKIELLWPHYRVALKLSILTYLRFMKRRYMLAIHKLYVAMKAMPKTNKTK